MSEEEQAVKRRAVTIFSSPSEIRTAEIEKLEKLEDQAPNVPAEKDDILRERYSDIAKQFEREDGLVHTRTSWMLTSEGVLFTGAAGIAAGLARIEWIYDHRSPIYAGLLGISLLMSLGVVIAITSARAIRAAHEQLNYLRTGWYGKQGDKLRERYVRPFGDVSVHQKGNDFPLVIAVVAFYVCLVAAVGALLSLAYFVVSN